MEPFAQFADQETPGQRAHLDQFRRTRDAPENRRQKVAAREQRCRNKEYDPDEREQQDAERQVFQVWLDREKENRREILEDENAERDASGQGVELLFFVKHFHDDDRAAQGGGQAEIQRV